MRIMLRWALLAHGPTSAATLLQVRLWRVLHLLGKCSATVAVEVDWKALLPELLAESVLCSRPLVHPALFSLVVVDVRVEETAVSAVGSQ
jgi:hypothetical protein